MASTGDQKGKLAPYLTAMCWAHARGVGYLRLRDMLAVGLVDDAGVRLAGVSCGITAVRERLRSPAGKKLLVEYRRSLYGEPYAQPLAHSGRRLQALSDALESLEGEPCEACGRGGAPGKRVGDLVRIIESARKEEAQAFAGAVVPTAPEAPGNGRRPAMVNRGLVINILADGLAELARTGHAERVLEAIKGTPALPLSTREETPDPPLDASAGTTTHMGTALDRDLSGKIEVEPVIVTEPLPTLTSRKEAVPGPESQKAVQNIPKIIPKPECVPRGTLEDGGIEAVVEAGEMSLFEDEEPLDPESTS